MTKARKRATTVAVIVGTLGVSGAAQAAGGFGGPEYYAGVFAGSVSGKGESHDVGSNYTVPRKRKGTWGLLGGVNFRNGPWLLGAEADYSFGSKRQVSSHYPSYCEYMVCEVKSNWHVRGRFGYRVHNVDLFLTGGYAALKVTGNTYATPFISSVTLNGYSIGAGADFTVARHGVVRLEVLQDKYNNAKDFGNNTGYGVNNWKDTTIRAAAIFTF